MFLLPRFSSTQRRLVVAKKNIRTDLCLHCYSRLSDYSVLPLKKRGSLCEPYCSFSESWRSHCSEYFDIVFWDVTPCSLVDKYKCFGSSCWLFPRVLPRRLRRKSCPKLRNFHKKLRGATHEKTDLKSLPVFTYCLIVYGTISFSWLLTACSSHTEPIRSSEALVTNCQPTPRKIPEERRYRPGLHTFSKNLGFS